MFTKTPMPATAPSMAPCCSAGSTSPKVIATGVAPSRSNATVWNCDAKIRNLLALEVGEVTDRSFRDDAGRLGYIEPDAVQPFLGAKAEHQLQHRRIGGDALSVLHRLDQPGGGHDLEALVDADEELRRYVRRLDRAELRAFDLPRDRAQLACG